MNGGYGAAMRARPNSARPSAARSAGSRTTTRLVAAAAAVALGAGTVAACSSDDKAPAATPAPAASVADTSTLSYNSCEQVACEGVLNGARYKIEMPPNWNGTLLLWSHGYRATVRTPPLNEVINTAAENAPSRTIPGGTTDTSVARGLLDQGYAIAGSSYASNGWAVQDGVKAGEDLRQFFVDNVGAPRRTYVWGASLGGLISQLLSEKHPEWVSGAAPECGAVAGTTENLDGALAIGYMVQTLIDPKLKITNFASPQEAVAMFQRAQKSVTAAAQDVGGGGTAKVETIAAIAHLANKTGTYDGHDFPSTVAAHAESIITALAFTTFGQQEFATRVGGQGLDINGLDFSTSADDAALRPLVTGLKGDLDGYYRALASGTRPEVDPAAREQAAAQGETTGQVGHPTVTLHTEDDPLVPPSNERVLGDRIAAASGGVGGLVQLYTKAPQTYPAPAPYGAGHCNFTTTEQLGLVKVLDTFVRTGVRPTPRTTNTEFAQPTGLDTTYEALPFPLLQR